MDDDNEEYDYSDRAVKAVSLIELLYEYHGAGGYLHVVVDDGNISHNLIKWCLTENEEKENDPELKIVARMVGQFLLLMTNAECAAALEMFHRK